MTVFSFVANVADNGAIAAAELFVGIAATTLAPEGTLIPRRRSRVARTSAHRLTR